MRGPIFRGPIARLARRERLENLGMMPSIVWLPISLWTRPFNPDSRRSKPMTKSSTCPAIRSNLQESDPSFWKGAAFRFPTTNSFYSRRITHPKSAEDIWKSRRHAPGRLAARNSQSDEQREDLAILRVKRDILEKSELGILLTGMQNPDATSLASGVPIPDCAWANP